MENRHDPETPVVRVFLGGYPGAGKTETARYMTDRGWYSLDMDGERKNKVLPLLYAPVDHPAFQRTPLVAEGGFLGLAPDFQKFMDRFQFTTFWLTGSRKNLTESRLFRSAPWDNPGHVKKSDWIELVNKHRKVVRWDYEIQMWDSKGIRKSPEQVCEEITSCLKGPE